MEFIKNKKIKISIFLLITLASIEIYLRFYWGFCDSVLMMYSTKYEYIEQPNQNRFRFRKHVYYNSESMRSDEIDSSAIKILGFGDSVFNGGVQTDQDSTCSSLLSRELSDIFHKKTQVLNISAGSWGPDNCYAYLNERGDFNSKIIFLVVSSHDAYDVMDFNPVIDKVNRYESHQNKSAIIELIIRYVIPKLTNPYPNESNGIPNKSNSFNTGFYNFIRYCQIHEKPFFIYLNPDKTEVIKKKYKPEGDLIINFCKKNNIQCIEGLENAEISDYQGVIHLNNQGQRKMAVSIKEAILFRKQYLN